MDNNSDCKVEEIACCSPESGFGSEVQYSPSDALKESIDGVQFPNIQLSDASRNLDFLSIQHSKEEQTVLKIVDIKSLACTSIDANVQVEANCPSSHAINGTKRLRLQKLNNKKFLVLDEKVAKSTTYEPDSWKLDKNDIYDMNGTAVLSFSGLPVISKRNDYVLSHKNLDTFVMSLLSKEDRKKVFLSKTKIQNTVTNISNKQLDVSNELSTQSNSLQKNCCIKSSHNCNDEPAVISSKDLHSTSISVLQATKLVPNLDLNKSLKVSKQTNNKAEKIKRLKEIIKQKEKNLQTVRKNYGFIS